MGSIEGLEFLVLGVWVLYHVCQLVWFRVLVSCSSTNLGTSVTNNVTVLGL